MTDSRDRKAAEALVFDSHAVWKNDEERIDAIARALSAHDAAGFARGVESAATKMALHQEPCVRSGAPRDEWCVLCALLPSPAPNTDCVNRTCPPDCQREHGPLPAPNTCASEATCHICEELRAVVEQQQIVIEEKDYSRLAPNEQVALRTELARARLRALTAENDLVAARARIAEVEAQAGQLWKVQEVAQRIMATGAHLEERFEVDRDLMFDLFTVTNAAALSLPAGKAHAERVKRLEVVAEAARDLTDAFKLNNFGPTIHSEHGNVERLRRSLAALADAEGG